MVKRFAAVPAGAGAPVGFLSSLCRRVAAMRLSAVCFALFSCVSLTAAHAQTDREAMIKAAIVFKLTRYVAWPENAFSAEPDSLRICLAGDPGMVAAMSEAQGREVDGRRVDVIPIKAAEGVVGCNMLYLGLGEADRLDDLAATLRENSVVSVSEIPSFASSAGMIELVRRDRRFGFRINLANARSSRIEVSAQLLDLAEVVDSGDSARSGNQ
ncbi:MAG: YfiR family protein [Pseudomonadota bacterium]